MKRLLSTLAEDLIARMKANRIAMRHALPKLGMHTTYLLDVKNKLPLVDRGQNDVGVLKLLKLAGILGIRPSDLFRDLDKATLDPPRLTEAHPIASHLGRPLSAYDSQILGIAWTSIEWWIDDQKAHEDFDDPRELGELCDALYSLLEKNKVEKNPFLLRSLCLRYLYKIDD